MGLNWVEALVAHLHRLQGYLVIENEDFQMDLTAERSIRGHSDIVEINEVIGNLISVLKKRYLRPREIGKLQGIARFLLHLSHSGFLKSGQ
jgi:hypothetical protein